MKLHFSFSMLKIDRVDWDTYTAMQKGGLEANLAKSLFFSTLVNTSVANSVEYDYTIEVLQQEGYTEHPSWISDVGIENSCCYDGKEVVDGLMRRKDVFDIKVIPDYINGKHCMGIIRVFYKTVEQRSVQEQESRTRI